MNLSVTKTLNSLMLASALCLGAALPAWAGESLVGTYTCDGPGYQGVVKISKQGEIYHLRWTIGKEFYSGIGLLEGDVLSVSYYGKMEGVVAFRIDGDRLSGRWTSNKSGTVSTEVLTR